MHLNTTLPSHYHRFGAHQLRRQHQHYRNDKVASQPYYYKVPKICPVIDFVKLVFF